MFENFGKLRTFPSERNTRRTTKWNKIKDMHTLDIMCNVPVDIDKTFETKREIEKKKWNAFKKKKTNTKNCDKNIN